MRHRATPRRSGGCSVSGPSIWFVVLLTTAFGLLPSVGVAFGGQGQESSIVGQVKDESGSILPYVTVTATSPSLQVPQIDAVNNVLGEYRRRVGEDGRNRRLALGMYPPFPVSCPSRNRHSHAAPSPHRPERAGLLHSVLHAGLPGLAHA